MPITYNETGVTYDSTSYTWEGERYQPTVFPVAGIFVAWDDGPYVANPVWTEVTTDVRAFQTHRGRGSDFDQFDTGTAQITFDNRSRKYDPFYTSGTYYGKLLPRRQVKIVAQIGGVSYDVYRGFIAGWPVTWSEYGKDSTVTVQCFDALGLMVNEQVPTDWPEYYISTLSPAHYWKCNDSRGTATIRDKNGSGYPQLNVTTASAGIFFFEAQPMADGLIGNSLYAPSYLKSESTTNTLSDFSAAFWLLNPSQQSGGSSTLNFGFNGGQISFVWSNTADATIDIRNATNLRTYTITGLNRQLPNHFAIVVTINAGASPTAVIYLNGVQISPTSTAVVSAIPNSSQYINIIAVQVQEIAVFPSQLTSAQVQGIYNYSTARLSETTSARMDRILGTTSWPAALESFPAAPVGTVAEIGSGTGVIQELQLVADSEGGELYASKAGVLTMTARRDVFNATRSKNVQATISDSGAGIRYGSEIEIAYDADNLKNDVTVNYSGDGEVFATNAVTIAAYGAAATVVETQLDSPTSAADLATLELGVEGVLVPQLSTIDVSANTAAADWQSILALELLDRVNFKRTPAVGNQFSRDALINAIDHQVEPGQWRTQVTLSMRYTSPLTLDDPVLGKLDYNYLG